MHTPINRPVQRSSSQKENLLPPPQKKKKKNFNGGGQQEEARMKEATSSRAAGGSTRWKRRRSDITGLLLRVSITFNTGRSIVKYPAIHLYHPSSFSSSSSSSSPSSSSYGCSFSLPSASRQSFKWVPTAADDHFSDLMHIHSCVAQSFMNPSECWRVDPTNSALMSSVESTLRYVFHLQLQWTGTESARDWQGTSCNWKTRTRNQWKANRNLRLDASRLVIIQQLIYERRFRASTTATAEKKIRPNDGKER